MKVSCLNLVNLPGKYARAQTFQNFCQASGAVGTHELLFFVVNIRGPDFSELLSAQAGGGVGAHGHPRC